MSVPFLTIEKTQEIVANVVAQVTRSVTGTMGPNGTLVLIKNGSSKKVTKDGVTVARSIKFEDPREELVNKVLTEPAIKTDDECGDGTTTTIFLTGALYGVFRRHAGFRHTRIIQNIVNEVISELEANAIRITNNSKELFQLALTSSNNDEKLSELVTKIYRQSGDNFPEVEIKEGLDTTDKYQRNSGLTLPLVFSNPAFSAGGRGTYKNFVPVILDTTIRVNDKLAPTLNELQGKIPKDSTIVLIARSIENDVSSVLLHVNNQLGANRFIGLQTNAGGTVGTLIMQDLAVMFGAPMFTMLEDTVTKDIPVVPESIEIRGSVALLVDIADETQARIDSRVEEIKAQLGEFEASERFSVRARFNEKRIRDLKGELVTVYVGGNTISEVKERVDRFEDVIKAVKSALINGILPGVGTAILKAGDDVLDRYIGGEDEMVTAICNDLKGVFHAQYLKLVGGCHNLGLDGELAVIDLTTGIVGTPTELGIYDTAYASITALRGGLQTAKILASLDSLIISDKLAAVEVHGI